MPEAAPAKSCLLAVTMDKKWSFYCCNISWY